jgi:hypothetical protein
MLYDASQNPPDPNHQSSTRQIKDKDEALIIEFRPASTAGTLHDEDGTCRKGDGNTRTTLEGTTDKLLRKNMFRAFDGTALITIGETPLNYITSLVLKTFDRYAVTGAYNEVSPTAANGPGRMERYLIRGGQEREETE